MSKNSLLLLFVISFFVARTSAQGNLQFNQVKYFQFNCTQSGGSVFTESLQTVTVPAGKVWKIESANCGSYSPTTNSLIYSSGGRVLLDSRLIVDVSSNTGFLPFWIPAGTYTIGIRSMSLTNGVQFLGSMSAIEFNIVP